MSGIYKHLGYAKVERHEGSLPEIFLPRRDRWLQHIRIWRGKHHRLLFVCRWFLLGVLLGCVASVAWVWASLARIGQ